MSNTDHEKTFALSTKGSTRADMNSSRAKQVSVVKRGLKSASIPTKIVHQIIDTPRDKAFGATSSRFTYKNEVEASQLPGPANYNLYKETIWKDNLESSSRLGFGNLTSRNFRVNKEAQYYNTGPGPGSYSIQKKEDDQHQQQISQIVSSIRKLQLQRLQHLHQHKLARKLPESGANSVSVGPGSYDVTSWKDHSLNNTAGVFFKSKSKRGNLGMLVQNKDFPTCLDYDVTRSILKVKPTSLKGMNAFIVHNKPKNIKFNDYDTVKKMVLNPKPLMMMDSIKSPALPGPGDYNVSEAFHNLTDRKPKQVRRVLNPKAKQPDIWVANNFPGPGNYNLPSAFSDVKYTAFDSAFISTTERKTLDIRPAANINAPFSLELEKSKKDFNKINRDKKKDAVWI